MFINITAGFAATITHAPSDHVNSDNTWDYCMVGGCMAYELAPTINNVLLPYSACLVSYSNPYCMGYDIPCTVCMLVCSSLIVAW